MNSSILKGLSLSALALACAPLLAATPAPVPVRDVDRPSAQPVTGACTAEADGPGVPISGCVLYTVPAGKRLVVETVSWDGTTQGVDVLTRVLFGPSQAFTFLIALGPQTAALNPGPAVQASNNRYYAGAQPLRLYLDAGQQLKGQFEVTAPGYIFNGMFTGYLVDN